MKVFNDARIKLTAWYLVIIMLISILFSLAIYKGTEYELDLHLQRHEALVERFGEDIEDSELLTPSDNEEIRRRVVISLIAANGIIFLIAGGVGYFLAGRTLKPIKDMVDEQSRFIADASHELRTPLTAMRTSLEVNLRDKKLSLPIKSLLQIYLKEVGSLQRLSDSLLELARIQKPNLDLKFNDVYTQEVIEEVCKKIQPLALEKNVVIKKKIENVAVYGNRKGLVDLLTAILDNAIKYSKKKGEILIAVFKENGRVKVKVKDNGIGIARDDLPHIFDRFYRADQSRTRGSEGGFGLGLSIAKEIAELHGGHIDVVSAVNKGSTFTVSLPAQS